jgi:hypothetical protein
MWAVEWNPLEKPSRLRGRIVYGAAALFTADLITGMAAFSLITLGTLWYFCTAYLRISAQYQANGMTVSSGAQILEAWFGVVVAIPLMALTAYLAWRAYAIPRSIYRMRSPGPIRGIWQRHGPT